MNTEEVKKARVLAKEAGITISTTEGEGEDKTLVVRSVTANRRRITFGSFSAFKKYAQSRRRQTVTVAPDTEEVAVTA